MSSQHIFIHAIVVAKADKVDELKQRESSANLNGGPRSDFSYLSCGTELQSVVSVQVANEPDTLYYKVIQDAKDQTRFYVHEEVSLKWHGGGGRLPRS